MSRTPHRTRPLPALLVSSLAIAVLGLHGRALAQEDDDDDKLPPPVTHHVVKSQGSEAPDDDSKIEAKPAPEKPAPRARPSPPSDADDDFGPEVAPLAPPQREAKPPAKPAAAEESDFGPPPEAKPPPPKKHHKETKREKRERLRKEKLAKKHQKARPTVQHEEVAPARPEVERTPEVHRPVQAAPAGPGMGDDDSEPATVEQGSPTRASPERHPAPHEVGEGEARRPSGDMDFDLLPQKTQSAEEATAIEGKIKTRRAMLQWHQGFGIATAALMAGTVITGQLNYSDRFGGGGSSGQYEAWHDAFEAATVVSFTTAGLLAILTPTPFEHKSDGVDTVTVHKWSMLVATIGMGAEVPLGIWTVTREGYVNQGTLALTHLIIGYVTAAALTVGASALFF